jgi:hypothetical protein
MNTNTDHATPELFAALSKAQGEIENASKNAANPHFKSKYADLAEILNTTRPVFAANGLSLSQFPGFDGSLASVTTVVAHSSGGYITAVASCVPAKSDAQGIGSATTYLRRYSAAAAAGIAQEDDDGQAAAHNKKPTPLTAKVTPTDGAWEAQTPESQAFLLKLAAEVVGLFNTEGAAAAADHLQAQGLDTDEKTAIWTRLDSAVRTGLKKAITTTTKEAA